MRREQPHSFFQACVDCAEGLLDIFHLGATALEDADPEDDAANLHNDLLQLGNDFRRVMLQIDAGNLPE